MPGSDEMIQNVKSGLNAGVFCCSPETEKRLFFLGICAGLPKFSFSCPVLLLSGALLRQARQRF